MREDVLDLGITNSNVIADRYEDYLQRTTTAGGVLELICTKDWVLEAAKKLEALGRLQQGWDSHKGAPLDPVSRDQTVQVLDWLRLVELPTPAVVLGSGGEVHLEWCSKGRELEVELGRDRKLGFVKVFSDGRIEESEEKDDLPFELRRHSRWLLFG